MLPVLLLLMLPAALQAQDYTYTINEDNTITITAYNGTDGDVSIPDTIDDYSVTGIGDSAFDSSSLTSVIIPFDSVTSIGDYAFNNCSSLASVTLGANVAGLGVSAFDSCSSLSQPHNPRQRYQHRGPGVL